MWGICLGYEFLIDYTTDKEWEDVFGSYFIDSESLELEFPISPKKTKFYRGLGNDAQEFTSKNLTYNSHDWGLNPDHIKSDKNLSNFWNLTALSYMPNNASAEFPHGMPFVASVEAKDYPIFGTQYHPEKPSSEWVPSKKINHSWRSIELQRHFGEMFVKMARANANTFDSKESSLDINNYDVIMTANKGPVYVFK